MQGRKARAVLTILYRQIQLHAYVLSLQTILKYNMFVSERCTQKLFLEKLTLNRTYVCYVCMYVYHKLAFSYLVKYLQKLFTNSSLPFVRNLVQFTFIKRFNSILYFQIISFVYANVLSSVFGAHTSTSVY